jgi:translation initiation factor IF-2
LVVKAVFKTTKSELICGGEVTKGHLTVPSFAKVVRDKDVLAEVEVTKLQRGPQDTKEVLEGEMCGVSLATTTKLDLQEGDRLEFFTRKTVARTL